MGISLSRITSCPGAVVSQEPILFRDRLTHPRRSQFLPVMAWIGVLIRILGLVNLLKLEELLRDAMVSEWSGPRWRQGPIPITSFSSSWASASIYDRPPLNPIRGKQSGDCTTAAAVVRFRVSWVVFSASTLVGSLSVYLRACASGRVIVTIPTSAAAPVGFTPKEFRLPAISPRLSVVRPS